MSVEDGHFERSSSSSSRNDIKQLKNNQVMKLRDRKI
ncbi:hypothetical protein Y032_0954g3193, partial [Ancylostoma ceylanicum]